MYTREIQFDLTNFTQPFTDCLNRVRKRLLNSLIQTEYPVHTYNANVLLSQKELFSKVNTMATNVVEQL